MQKNTNIKVILGGNSLDSFNVSQTSISASDINILEQLTTPSMQMVV